MAQSGATGTGTHPAPREHRPPRGRSSNRPCNYNFSFLIFLGTFYFLFIFCIDRGRGGDAHVGEEGEIVNRGSGSRRGPMGRGGGRGGGRGSSRGGRGSRPPRIPRNSQPSEPCWDNATSSGQQDAPMGKYSSDFIESINYFSIFIDY